MPAPQFHIITGADQTVMDWAKRNGNVIPVFYNAVFGIADEMGKIRGAFMFNNWNMFDIEVHFFGPGTLKTYIVREIFARAIVLFNVTRMTVRTRKASMGRGVLKLGAIYEGRQLRYYGPTDEPCHAAEVYVFFRERMELLAGLRKYVQHPVGSDST